MTSGAYGETLAERGREPPAQRHAPHVQPVGDVNRTTETAKGDPCALAIQTHYRPESQQCPRSGEGVVPETESTGESHWEREVALEETGRRQHPSTQPQ